MPGQKPFAQCLGQVASWNAHAGKKNSVVAEDLEQQLPTLFQRKKVHAIAGDGDLALGPDRELELNGCHENLTRGSIADWRKIRQSLSPIASLSAAKATGRETQLRSGQTLPTSTGARPPPPSIRHPLNSSSVRFSHGNSSPNRASIRFLFISLRRRNASRVRIAPPKTSTSRPQCRPEHGAAPSGSCLHLSPFPSWTRFRRGPFHDGKGARL
jgi:hypothetical protein